MNNLNLSLSLSNKEFKGITLPRLDTIIEEYKKICPFDLSNLKVENAVSVKVGTFAVYYLFNSEGIFIGDQKVENIIFALLPLFKDYVIGCEGYFKLEIAFTLKNKLGDEYILQEVGAYEKGTTMYDFGMELFYIVRASMEYNSLSPDFINLNDENYLFRVDCENVSERILEIILKYVGVSPKVFIKQLLNK